jgi:hypothetical protein
MKYIRGNQTWKIEGATSVKMRFKDNEDFVETPWGAKSPDGKEYALLNHALAFTPALSWGAIFDNTNVMFTPILEKQELTLHPEAYDYYEKEGVIDKEGNYTPKPES